MSLAESPVSSAHSSVSSAYSPVKVASLTPCLGTLTYAVDLPSTRVAPVSDVVGQATYVTGFLYRRWRGALRISSHHNLCVEVLVSSRAPCLDLFAASRFHGPINRSAFQWMHPSAEWSFFIHDVNMLADQRDICSH